MVWSGPFWGRGFWDEGEENEDSTGNGGILDYWKGFGEDGGLKKVDYLELMERREGFAMAALVVAAIKEAVSTGQGSLADDLQECLRIWRMVRLG